MRPSSSATDAVKRQRRLQVLCIRRRELIFDSSRFRTRSGGVIDRRRDVVGSSGFIDLDISRFPHRHLSLLSTGAFRKLAVLLQSRSAADPADPALTSALVSMQRSAGRRERRYKSHSGFAQLYFDTSTPSARSTSRSPDRTAHRRQPRALGGTGSTSHQSGVDCRPRLPSTFDGGGISGRLGSAVDLPRARDGPGGATMDEAQRARDACTGSRHGVDAVRLRFHADARATPLAAVDRSEVVTARSRARQRPLTCRRRHLHPARRRAEHKPHSLSFTST